MNYFNYPEKSLLMRIASGFSESMVIEWKPPLSQINEIIESIAAFKCGYPEREAA